MTEDLQLTPMEEKWFRAAKFDTTDVRDVIKQLDPPRKQQVIEWAQAGLFADEEPTQPKVDSKIATAALKVPLDRIPLQGLYGVARVFGYGGKKHGWGNFFQAMLDDGAAHRYAGGYLRHLAKLQGPDGVITDATLASLDEESGLPEIDHALAGLIMLRIIATKSGALPADPGVGNDPPSK